MSVAVAGLGGAGRLLLQRMFRPQPIADVGLAALEQGVLVDEILVDATGLDDVVGDGVEDAEIGLRLEHHADVGEIERAVLECRQHGDADMRRAQPPIGRRGVHRIGCISAMFEPHSTNASAASMSS